MNHNYISEASAKALMNAFNDAYPDKKTSSQSFLDSIKGDVYTESIERTYTYETDYRSKREISRISIVERRIDFTKRVIELNDVTKIYIDKMNVLNIFASPYYLRIEIEPKNED